jgi:phosphoribosyl 1,2-cyclic phosphodiesterase
MVWLAVWSAIERHGDHANKDTIKRMIRYGIPVYSCEEVAHDNKGVITAKKKEKILIGGFKIQPIPLHHSCECYGYIIEHEEIGKLVFCTDTYQIPYRFKGVNHFVVEANHSTDKMIDNMCINEQYASAYDNHMNIDDTIEFLKANQHDDLVNVVLIHLSDGNSDEKEFIQRTKKELCLNNVFVANKGLIVELCKEEF